MDVAVGHSASGGSEQDLSQASVSLRAASSLRELASLLEQASFGPAIKDQLEEWIAASSALSAAIRLAAEHGNPPAVEAYELGKAPAMLPARLAEGVFVPAFTALDVVERALIEDTLSRVGNNKTETARILGITARTISNKFHRYSIEDQAGMNRSTPVDLSDRSLAVDLDRISIDLPIAQSDE